MSKHFVLAVCAVFIHRSMFGFTTRLRHSLFLQVLALEMNK